MSQPDALLNARILIIDDQEVNIRLLELILRREGFGQISSTSDPHRALPLFADFRPDIVLLDLLMPGLDGFAILELLRRRIPEGEFLPVLVLTADSTTETRRRALALGAKDFLTKPIDQIEVMLRIWNLLETRLLYLRLWQQNPHALNALAAPGLDRLSAQIAQRLGLDDAQVRVLREVLAQAAQESGNA